jgi:alkylation response protein AidB-like acyl-CoA dehydrogenase
MNFDDAPEDATYRAGARQWLELHAPAYSLPQNELVSEGRMVDLARAWQSLKAQAGYAGIAWPREVGGQGGTPLQHLVFQHEESRFRVPTMLFAVGLGMCVPTLISMLPGPQALPFVERAKYGRDIWCQLFSEPAAGSDLAGIHTRAHLEGDSWIVSGQKVWTSYAHYSTHGLLLTRTDPGVPKHQGLTMFYVDMRSPGIETRPIRTLRGEADFNEVFLSNVRIADTQRLGAVGGGWQVALKTLMNERMAIGKPADAPGAVELMSLATSITDDRGRPQIENPAVREMIARTYVIDTGLEFLKMRAQTALERGQQPGPEAAIGKLLMAKARQDLGAFALDLLESAGLGDTADARGHAFLDHYLLASGLRIAGGTDEILRSVIAERVLGLPGDLRVDKDLPFNQFR